MVVGRKLLSERDENYIFTIPLCYNFHLVGRKLLSERDENIFCGSWCSAVFLVGRKLLSERDENSRNPFREDLLQSYSSEGNYSLKEMRTGLHHCLDILALMQKSEGNYSLKEMRTEHQKMFHSKPCPLILSEGNYSLKEMRTAVGTSLPFPSCILVGRKLLSERDENTRKCSIQNLAP